MYPNMNWIKFNWLKVVAIFLLIGALFSIPYFAYYQLMNWVVVGAALVTAWQAHAYNKGAWMWLFILVAVIFNPLAPFYFRTDVWQIADIVVAVLFMISFIFIRTKAE